MDLLTFYIILYSSLLRVSFGRPNIIILVADDLGWNDLSFHGSSQIPTPNLDYLANNGIILNNYYVCPICSPSRSALMTGFYPIHTGLQHDVIYVDQPWGLPLSKILLPQYLRKLGYSTHAVGKWHLGFFRKEYTPTFRGFDSHYGYWGGKEDYFDHTQQMGEMWGLDFHHNMKSVTDALGKYSTALFTNHTVHIIKHHNSSKPLFLYVAYQAVHSANSYATLQAPENYIKRFPNIKDKNRKIFAGGNVSNLGKLDGYDLWDTLSFNRPSPRSEVLLNIDPINKVSALRVGNFKVIQGTVYGGQWDGWYGPSGRENFTQTRNAKSSSEKLYHKAEITCGPIPKNATSSCYPAKKPCLFDVQNDPCEYYNLAEDKPHMLDTLLKKLAEYSASAVPPGNKPLDPQSNPKYHNYQWINWKDYV
ncbi:arylsulfatase B-like isoform X8 [Stegodyphus dumicola]|uniref:arylsulfatase B-like isoform X8 n=1 Tax=Stegodyphus dumicola TaxID=202533 RepID=UPI0015AD09DA|nr:arylsulfatase B-like isoform X8 [Stegodyphus dumicola]